MGGYSDFWTDIRQLLYSSVCNKKEKPCRQHNFWGCVLQLQKREKTSTTTQYALVADDFPLVFPRSPNLTLVEKRLLSSKTFSHAFAKRLLDESS